MSAFTFSINQAAASLILTVLLTSCGSEEKPVVEPNQPKDCSVLTQSSGQTGNGMSATYEYAPDGTIARVTRQQTGQSQSAIETFEWSSPGKISKIHREVGGNKTTISFIHSSNPDGKHPAFGDLYENGQHKAGWDFIYNSQGRLTDIEYVTDLSTDQDWKLHLSYSGSGNIQNISRSPLNGGAILSQYSVTSFDARRVPFTALPPFYALMQIDWSALDALPLIIAFSQNNPLDYTAGDMHRSFTYQYSSEGYPELRKIQQTITGSSSPATWNEFFTYSCH